MSRMLFCTAMGVRAWIVLAAVASVAGVAQEANSLVVLIKGDRAFHQPGCVLVARAGSNVTVSKRAEATRRGLTAHDCGPEASGGPAVDPNAEKVATQSGDNKYHRLTCTKLGPSRSTLTVGEAGRKLWPCPACRPPIRKPPPAS